MSTAVAHLEQALSEHKSETENIDDRINRHVEIIEELKRTKQEIEISIKDIELALSLLRKI